MRSGVTEKTVNSQWSCGVKGQEAGAERQLGIGRKNEGKMELSSFQGRVDE